MWIRRSDRSFWALARSTLALPPSKGAKRTSITTRKLLFLSFVLNEVQAATKGKEEEEEEEACEGSQLLLPIRVTRFRQCLLHIYSSTVLR